MEEKEKDRREILAVCLAVVAAFIFFIPYPNDLIYWIASSTIFLMFCALVFIFYYKNFDFEIFKIIMNYSRSLVMIFFSLVYFFVSTFVSGSNVLQNLSWLIGVYLIVFLDCQRELITRKTILLYFVLFLGVNVQNLMVIYGLFPGSVSAGIMNNVVGHGIETELRRSSIINILQVIISSLIHYTRQVKYRNVPKDYYTKEIDYLMVVTSIVRIQEKDEDKKLKSSQKIFIKGKSLLMNKMSPAGGRRSLTPPNVTPPGSEASSIATPITESEVPPQASTDPKKVKDNWLIRYRGMLVKIICVIFAACFITREFTNCLSPGGVLLNFFMMACQFPIMILLGYKNIDYRILKIIFSVPYSKIGLLSVAVIIYISGCMFQVVYRFQNNDFSDASLGQPYCLYENVLSTITIVNVFLVALLLDILQSQFLLTKRIIVGLIFLGLTYQWYCFLSGKYLFNQYFRLPGSSEVFSYQGIMLAAIENCLVTSFITAVSMFMDTQGLQISFASARVKRSSDKIVASSPPEADQVQVVNIDTSTVGEVRDSDVTLEMVVDNRFSRRDSTNLARRGSSISGKGETVQLRARIHSINPLQSNIKFASVDLENLGKEGKQVKRDAAMDTIDIPIFNSPKEGGNVLPQK